MEKLNRAQKCSILGPQNLGSRGGPGPRAPPGSAPVMTLSEYALYTEIFNVLANSDNVHLQVCHTAMNLSSFCECFQAHIFVHILDLVDIHLRFLGHVVWWWIQEFMPLGKYLHLSLLSADHLY